jgi:hypothetical protein
MINFWLRRRNLLKVGDLVDWADFGFMGAYSHLVGVYGKGPFRIIDRKYESDEDRFYFRLSTMQDSILQDWFVSDMVTKYNWGVS